MANEGRLDEIPDGKGFVRQSAERLVCYFVFY